MDKQSARRICELVMGIIAVDGELHKKELTFMLKTFEAFGIPRPGSDQVINPTIAFEDAKSQMTALPEAARLAALTSLIEAAVADGKVVPEEQTYLNAVASAAAISEERLDEMVVEHLLAHSSAEEGA